MSDRSEQKKLLKKFPLLIPNKGFSEYNGFFCAGSKEMYLHIILPNKPLLSGMIINDCSWELITFFREYEKEVEKWTATSNSLYKFLNWLQTVIVTHNLFQNAPQNPPINLWKKLFEDIKVIGFDKVNGADTDNLTWIDLKITDIASRDHMLKVKLQYALLQFEVDLPTTSAKMIQNTQHVVRAFELFECEVSKLQLFWNAMEEIDENCNVRDPQSPGPADTHRQIALESDVTFILNVDPYNPLAQPDIRILGLEAKIEPLKRILAELKWHEEGTSLFEKLQDAFGIAFSPSKRLLTESQSYSQLSQNEMCCICLLADNLDETCNGCHSVFHVKCLREWLQSIPNNCLSFKTISGKCPVCQEPISCVL